MPNKPNHTGLPTPAELGVGEQYATWRADQDAAFAAALNNDKFALALNCPTGMGKCTRPDQIVIRADGAMVRADSIQAGDHVMGADGLPREVLGTHFGKAEMWRIAPVKGDAFEVTYDHILTLVHTQTWEVKDVALNVYLGWSKTQRHLYKLFRAGVSMPMVALPIDPYFVGLLLGDGGLTKTTPIITTADGAILQECSDQSAKWGLTGRVENCGDKAVNWHFSRGVVPRTRKGHMAPNALTAAIKDLGMNCLSGAKRIPELYLRSGTPQRLELLAGLIDTDGALSSNCFDYVSKSKGLADDVVRLSRSLGLAAYAKDCVKWDQNGTVGVYWRVTISGHTDKVPCRLDRKKARPRAQAKDVLRTGFSVEPVGEGGYYGFQIEGDGRFLLGDYTVTHNTVLGVSFKQLTGMRTCFLTKNNGLLDQYGELFRSIGLRTVKGMSNYACDGMTIDQYRMWKMTARTDQPPDCSDGPCHDGFKCDLKKSGCKYYDAVRGAGGFTATNYAFWLANQEYSQEKIGPYDLLVMDEADAAPEELTRFISDEITTWEVENLLRSKWPKLSGEQVREWAAWAKLILARVEKLLEPGGPIRGRERKMIRATAKRLSTVTHVADEGARWLVSDTPKGKRFAPLWPAPYRHMLFRDAKQIMLLSATVMPKTLKLLGLDESEFQFHQFPSSFPIERRLITRIPTIQVKSGAPHDAMLRWVGMGDAILRPRLDRKGIWHTVSYNLASWVLRESRYSKFMVSHEGDGKLRDHGQATVFRTPKEAIAYYRAQPGPCFLVSPSVSTGYDFAGSECEVQIIGKLAFPDTRDPLMAARCAEDDEYRAYVVMRELVQQSGRGMRSASDFCETLIIDDMAEWFLRRWGYLAPYWWAEAYREMETVPMPPAIRAT